MSAADDEAGCGVNELAAPVSGGVITLLPFKRAPGAVLVLAWNGSGTIVEFRSDPMPGSFEF